MRNLSKKDKIILIFLIFLGIFYGYYALLLKPILNDNNKKSLEISEAKDKLEKINMDSTANAKYKKQLTDLKIKYEDALKVLPHNERDPEIALQIKTLADKNGIALTLLDFSKPVEVKDTKSLIPSKTPIKLMSVPIIINAVGDYENAVNFLKALEDNERIAIIDMATFNSNEKVNGTNKAGEVIIALNASYYFTLVNAGEGTLQYDFNKGAYGKNNVFK